jgi:purine-cytosine permease-like protein
MPDPRYRHVARHNHSSAFWGIALVFAVLMLGLVAYGYHGIHTTQTSSSTTRAATTGQSTIEGGQSTTEGAARAPTPAPARSP